MPPMVKSAGHPHVQSLVVAHRVTALDGSLLRVPVHCVVGGAAIVTIRYIHRNQGR